MMKLQSERLSVTICAPDEVPCVSQRFDRTAFITQVVLDGKYEMCSKEPPTRLHPSTGGQGLCSEIQCTDADERSIIGERFPKFGVGALLKTEDKPYRFSEAYDNEPFQFLYNAKEDQAVFMAMPKNVLGMALEEEKRVCVRDNELIVDYTFANRGEHPLTLREYCHNFITLHHTLTDERFRLDVEGLRSQEGKMPKFGGGNLRGTPFGFGFEGRSDGQPSLIRAEEGEICTDENIPFTWRLSHADLPLMVTGTPGFVPGAFAVWTVDEMVCPEVFHCFTLQSGETIHYDRRWKFDTV